MPRISKPPEERRQEIIDTAYALFLANGYENTTVRDIVQKLGVAQGLFYYYFKSKEDVLMAAVDQAAEVLLSEIAGEISDAGVPAVERIRRTFALISGFLLRGNDMLLLPNVSVQMRGRIEQQTRDLLLPYLTQLAVDGQENGEFSLPYPGYTVRFILSGFVNLCMAENAPRAEEVTPLIEGLVERILALPTGTFTQ